MMLTRRRKVLIITGIIIVALIGLTLALGSKNVKVTVQALPADSQITLDGKAIKGGVVKLSPGSHTFKATRQDFDPAVKTVNTKGLDTSQIIYLLPVPSGTAGIEYLSEHPAVQQQRESASGQNAAQIQQDLSTRYPILSQLPYQTTDYLISYSLDSSNKLSLQITVYPISNQQDDPDDYNQQVSDYKQEALKFLHTNGVNTTTLSITYSVSYGQN